ncbi:tRNA1(Val) (adenine(37)-N6)-methyltransferase [Alkaliflexus imshenetskii]|uniref:tRNA1(Val) (adenine(37)-N6)-methyltransferase n=1 Tax=Alkaliflexus imshenetskii TaxID=286730 RepID=UPI00047A8781|nr:methyltransferase [Alkaliflexus imshenetskii]
MPNNYFQFKQFTIRQDLAAMKVGTDGVLLGAWAPVADANTILDVGTGTGLIALMLAQRNPHAKITGIEIDEAAFNQASQNVADSPWSERIKIVFGAFQTMIQSAPHQFDLIVSNPPFFVNSQKALCPSRTLARHTSELSHDDLLTGAKKLLSPSGKLALILPYPGYRIFSELAVRNELYEIKRLTVFPTPEKAPSRVLAVWGVKNDREPVLDEMILEINGRHNYSDAYIELTKAFYLKMKD